MHTENSENENLTDFVEYDVHPGRSLPFKDGVTFWKIRLCPITIMKYEKKIKTNNKKIRKKRRRNGEENDEEDKEQKEKKNFCNDV